MFFQCIWIKRFPLRGLLINGCQWLLLTWRVVEMDGKRRTSYRESGEYSAQESQPKRDCWPHCWHAKVFKQSRESIDDWLIFPLYPMFSPVEISPLCTDPRWGRGFDCQPPRFSWEPIQDFNWLIDWLICWSWIDAVFGEVQYLEFKRLLMLWNSWTSHMSSRLRGGMLVKPSNLLPI